MSSHHGNLPAGCCKMTRTPTKLQIQMSVIDTTQQTHRWTAAQLLLLSSLGWKRFQNEKCADDKEGISPSAGHQITFDLWQSRHGQFTMATSRIEFRCKVSLMASKCGLNIKTGSDHSHSSVLRFSQCYRDQFLLGRYRHCSYHVCWEASHGWSFRLIFGGFPLVIIGFMNQLHK